MMNVIMDLKIKGLDEFKDELGGRVAHAADLSLFKAMSQPT